MISRKPVRDYLAAKISALPELDGISVLKKRRIHIDEDIKQFVNVYFIQADVDITGSEESTSIANIEIRVNSCLPGDDDILDNLADPITEMLDSTVNLNGLTENFRLIRWSYGDDEDSAFSFFSMIYRAQLVETL